MNVIGEKVHLEDILADPTHTRVVDIVVLSGEGKLPRGAMLGKVTSSGKYRLWDTRNTDGSEVFVGVLGCDVDATTSDAKAFAYVEGTFLKEKLICGYGQVPTGSFLYGNIVIK